MRHTTTAFDRTALAIGGGSMLFGIVVLGIVEVLDGAPYGAAPILDDTGAVIASPTIDPTLRTGLVILGLLILLLWGLYRVAVPEWETARRPATESTAD